MRLQVFFLPFNMAFANAMVTLFVFDSAESARGFLWDTVRSHCDNAAATTF